MINIDWQKAATDAFQRIIQDALTEPMTADELGIIFGMGYRALVKHLATLDGLVRAGSFYRVPLRLMPPQYIAEVSDSCQFLRAATQTLLNGVERSHANSDSTTTCNAAANHTRRPERVG